MFPATIQKLIDLFTKLPGIGPRQAARFVFFMLKNRLMASEISAAVENLNKITFCAQCFRAIEEKQEASLCSFCADKKREQNLIAVIEKESDMQNLEKTGAYRGVYHILGGVISPLDSESPKNLHLKELFKRVKNILERENKCEVILATSTTTEGDTTALYIERILSPLKESSPNFKISRLGRGLSLGAELEYADEITLKNALTNRK